VVKLLVPVDGSTNAVNAVEQVIREVRGQQDPEVYLLNVQPAFSRHIAQFTNPDARRSFRQERGMRAMQQSSSLLKNANISHSCHVEVGDSAKKIAEFALRNVCDCIVIGAARKSAFMRMLVGSVSSKVLTLTKTPVEIIPGVPAFCGHDIAI
jgi:nucleotide-binding universal stress UspA family protein